MRAIAGLHLGLLTVDQQIEHVRLDRAVDHGQLLAVIEGVEHRHFKGSAQGDGGLAGLQVNLNAVALGECLEAGAETIQRVTLAGEVNTAAQTDPAHLFEQVAKTLFDLSEHLVEQLKVAVLAVVVNHKARDQRQHGLDLGSIPLAQAAERTGRISNQKVRAADAGVQAQTTHGVGRNLTEAGQLTDGVEDDLVRMRQDFVDLVIGIGHAVGMRLSRKLDLAKFDFVQRGGCRAVHILTHKVEYGPGSKALECEQGLGAGVFTHVGDLLHIAFELALVDEIVRRFDQFGHTLQLSTPDTRASESAKL